MSVIGEAFVKIRPETAGFAGEAGSKVKEGLHGILSPVLGALAIGGIAEFGKSTVEAFEKAQQSQLRFQDAFERFPKLADTSKEAFERLNHSLEQKTKFDHVALETSEAQLAQYGLTGTQVKGLIPLVEDYAAKTGKDLPEAAKLAGAAILGKGRALKELGVNFKDLKDPQQNFNELTDILRTKVGGFAEKEGATFSGRMSILHNQIELLKEGIGKQLVGALSAFAGILIRDIIPGLEAFAHLAADKLGPPLSKLRDLVEAVFKNVVRTVRDFIQTFKDPDITSSGFFAQVEKFASGARRLYDSLRPVIEFIRDHAKPIFIALAVALGLAFAPITTIVGGLIILYARFKVVRDIVAVVAEAMVAAFEHVRDFVKAVWPEIHDIIAHAVEGIRQVIEAVVTVVLYIWDHFGKQITEYVQTAFANAKEIVTGVIHAIEDVIKIVLDLISGHWGKAWNAIKDLVSTVIHTVYDVVERTLRTMLTIAGELLGKLLGAVRDKIGDVLGFFGGIGKKILDAIGNLGSLLLDVGKDLILGLVHGIENAWHFVTEKVTSLTHLIPGPIRHILGLGSPSRLFHGFGVNIVEGLALGIEQSTGGVLTPRLAALANHVRSLGFAGGAGRDLGGGFVGTSANATHIHPGAVVVHITGASGDIKGAAVHFEQAMSRVMIRTLMGAGSRG